MPTWIITWNEGLLMRYAFDMIVWTVFGIICAKSTPTYYPNAPGLAFAFALVVTGLVYIATIGITKTATERELEELKQKYGEVKTKIAKDIHGPLREWFSGNDRSKEPAEIDMEKLELKIVPRRIIPK